MDELSFAEETINRMKELYGLAGHHEVIRRTIISRIYYSAHHLSRYILRRVGLRPETWRRNVHQMVIDEIHRQFVTSNLMNAQIVSFLEIMRRHRVNADYQLHLTISESDAEEMFASLSSLLRKPL
ncbi:HEPN domain-containing protein [Candidatus Poribacteria bacterium]|nr:HEPN domain-containing protein [Candidatus Poribacteria bacterium]